MQERPKDVLNAELGGLVHLTRGLHIVTERVCGTEVKETQAMSGLDILTYIASKSERIILV